MTNKRATARRAEQEARAQKIEAAMARMRAARAAQPEPTTQDPVPQPVDDYRAVLLIANNRDETVVHVAFSECLVVGAQNLVGSQWSDAGSEDAVVQPAEEIAEDVRRGRYLDAREALDYGLIDEITAAR